MKFISSESGQSLQLVVMDEIRPLRGGVFLPDLITAIVQRYRFVSFSTQADPAQPIKFQTGVFQSGEITMPIISLEIYTDGVIMNSRTTDDADAIVNDFSRWLIDTFKLREPTTIIPRTYQSKIIVSLDGPLDRFVAQFQPINAILSKAFNTHDELHVTRLFFGPHPPGPLPYQTTWSIEPRIGQPFVYNRYFSSAPLTTKAHIELLAEIEATLE